MAEPLEGVEFRVFRSLDIEWDRDTLEAIRVELTRGPEVSSDAVEEALHSLRDKGYAEEFEDGRWRITANGRGVRGSLLGQYSGQYSANDPLTCDICGALITTERGGELVRRSDGGLIRDADGELVWVHPGCAGRQPARPA